MNEIKPDTQPAAPPPPSMAKPPAIMTPEEAALVDGIIGRLLERAHDAERDLAATEREWRHNVRDAQKVIADLRATVRQNERDIDRLSGDLHRVNEELTVERIEAEGLRTTVLDLEATIGGAARRVTANTVERFTSRARPAPAADMQETAEPQRNQFLEELEANLRGARVPARAELQPAAHAEEAPAPAEEPEIPDVVIERLDTIDEADAELPSFLKREAPRRVE